MQNRTYRSRASGLLARRLRSQPPLRGFRSGKALACPTSSRYKGISNDCRLCRGCSSVHIKTERTATGPPPRGKHPSPLTKVPIGFRTTRMQSATQSAALRQAPNTQHDATEGKRRAIQPFGFPPLLSSDAPLFPWRLIRPDRELQLAASRTQCPSLSFIQQVTIADNC
jgi:hypothetical protein